MEVKSLLKVALVQYDIVWENVDCNLSRIEGLLSQIKGEVDVIILPESFTTGFSIGSVRLAEGWKGRTVEWMESVSKKYDSVVCGSFFVKEGGKCYNRFVWVEDSDRLLHYDKRHLFSPGGEVNYFTKGTDQLLIEYKGWRIFPTVCYDLRFPVWSRNTQSYDLMVNVANWPGARDDVWRTLLKARAIENQSYVIGVNRIGIDGEQTNYLGNSMIVDYKGAIINKINNEEEVIVQEIDYNSLQTFRRKFNTLNDMDRFILEY